MIPEVMPIDLAAEFQSDSPPIVLDVREAHELQISRLHPHIHIPMHEVPLRLGELDRESDLVVICRTGNRSRKVTHFLLGQGFRLVRNLATGINGWAETVDLEMETY